MHNLSNSAVTDLPRTAPIKRVHRPARAITLREIGCLMDQFDDRTAHMVRFVIVILSTCCRPSTALNLLSSQIDADASVVRLTPSRPQKNWREVPLADALMHLAAHSEGPIVNVDGRPISSVRTAWHTARTKADLGSDVTPFALRESMALQLADRGVPIDRIFMLLGRRVPNWMRTKWSCPAHAPFSDELKRAIDATLTELQQFTRHQLVPAQ